MKKAGINFEKIAAPKAGQLINASNNKGTGKTDSRLV
jgi:hypothetical protein